MVAVAVLVLVAFVSVAYGSKPIALGTVWDALFHVDRSVDDHLIVRELRLPRTVLGLLVGAALGAAGAVMQGLTRNPLADPGILGVEAGASLAVVFAIYLLDVSAFTGYVWFAFAGRRWPGPRSTWSARWAGAGRRRSSWRWPGPRRPRSCRR